MKMSLKEIRERHEKDDKVTSNLGTMTLGIHQDRAELLKLVDEMKSLLINVKVETTGKHREDIENALSKLD
jgi:hypothetical protein